MAFSKRTYTDGTTVITAENLNAIQDEIISLGNNKVPTARTVNGKALNQNIVLAGKDILTDISLPRDTAVNITLANSSAYVAFYIGGTDDKDILLILVGSTGNISVSSILGVSSLTIATTTNTLTITQTVSTVSRHLYFLPLNTATNPSAS